MKIGVIKSEHIAYDIAYVVIASLPKEEQESFNKWLWGQTCPIIDGETECAYLWDYNKWKHHWREGREAPVDD